MFKLYFILFYPLTLIALLLIKIYRAIVSKGLIKSCHFIPTCSGYAYLAIKEFGVIIGGVMAIKRLSRCRPNGKGEVDFPKLNLLGNYKWKC